MTLPSTSTHIPCLAFDALADTYDQLFTESLIGRAQRNAVWAYAQHLWKPGDHVLELNCGTGEDALFFSRLGVAVTACDSSAHMLSVATNRARRESTFAPVDFLQLANEQVGDLSPARFSGAFSNFSGLNCVTDLDEVAQSLAYLLPERAPVLLCFSTRFCIVETLWYLLHGDPRRATRRWSGHTRTSIGEHQVEVWYHTLPRLCSLFAPWFRFVNAKGIGVFVPPSYVEPLAQRVPGLLRAVESVDARVSHLPVLRAIGDHILLHFERLAA